MVVRSKFWKGALMGVAGGALAATGQAKADVTLDFEDFTGNNQPIGIPGTALENYGDRLTGAENIEMTWIPQEPGSTTTGWQTYTNWNGRGNVVQTDFLNGRTFLELDFTADAGWGSYVTQFDLDEWAGGGDTVINWSLQDSNDNVLYSGTWDEFSDAVGGNGGRTTIVTGMTAANALAGTLTLRLDYVSGAASYSAMDNLTFGQAAAVPEPSHAAFLAVAGLGAAAMRYRRRRRQAKEQAEG